MDLIPFEERWAEKWDKFVMSDSVNGTFLQTRNFLNYHPLGRFADKSLLFVKGNNIVAVLPANICEEDNGKILYSHQGSTFGGLVLGKAFKKISNLEPIMQLLDDYLLSNRIAEIELKMTSLLYSPEETALLDYFLQLYNYSVTYEMGYYIDFGSYADDIESNFTASIRRHYRSSLKTEFTFRELQTNAEIGEFYDVLCENYQKFGKLPVHTLDELLYFKNMCLKDVVRFYGVFQDDIMAAGSMVFRFAKKVFHTQYLACRHDMLQLFANNFLYRNLIVVAKELGFSKISFGTSTLYQGKVLNKSLAQFKEGFGTKEYINSTFKKILRNGGC